MATPSGVLGFLSVALGKEVASYAALLVFSLTTITGSMYALSTRESEIAIRATTTLRSTFSTNVPADFSADSGVRTIVVRFEGGVASVREAVTSLTGAIRAVSGNLIDEVNREDAARAAAQAARSSAFGLSADSQLVAQAPALGAAAVAQVAAGLTPPTPVPTAATIGSITAAGATQVPVVPPPAAPVAPAQPATLPPAAPTPVPTQVPTQAPAPPTSAPAQQPPAPTATPLPATATSAPPPAQGEAAPPPASQAPASAPPTQVAPVATSAPPPVVQASPTPATGALPTPTPAVATVVATATLIPTPQATATARPLHIDLGLAAKGGGTLTAVFGGLGAVPVGDKVQRTFIFQNGSDADYVIMMSTVLASGGGPLWDDPVNGLQLRVINPIGAEVNPTEAMRYQGPIKVPTPFLLGPLPNESQATYQVDVTLPASADATSNTFQGTTADVTIVITVVIPGV